MTQEDQNKFWTLFHKAWGHCKESPEYNKEVWKDLQCMIQRELEKK